MAKKKLLLIIFCLFFLTCVLSCGSVLAAATAQQQFDSGLNKTADGAGYKNNLKVNDPTGMIGRIVQVILAFLGVLFMILMIYGGFIWMTARGNEQEIQKAQSIIRNSLIGLVIVLSAYAISIFVMEKLSAETLKTLSS